MALISSRWRARRKILPFEGLYGPHHHRPPHLLLFLFLPPSLYLSLSIFLSIKRGAFEGLNRPPIAFGGLSGLSFSSLPPLSPFVSCLLPPHRCTIIYAKTVSPVQLAHPKPANSGQFDICWDHFFNLTKAKGIFDISKMIWRGYDMYIAPFRYILGEISLASKE